jgi:uncharacterized protein with ParB-like and HNH nuclease domain
MKADDVKISKFMQNTDTQFIIPVYQRNYDWEKSHCKQLIDDILHVGASDIEAHFIGSIVYIHDDVYSTHSKKVLTVIDGQQRLTTFTLIYIVLYRLACHIKNERLKEMILEHYLINKFYDDEEKLKLRPTENNDLALKFLLRNDNQEEFKGFSNIIENFEYLKTRISEENYETVMRGIDKIMFVEISLDRNKDSPQRIFESLNSTGLELYPSDKIRNYILMALTPKQQERIYRNYWLIIEKNAKDEISNKSKVSDFIRDYLTFKLRRIPVKAKVYQEFRDEYPITNIENLEESLSSLKTFSKYYNKLINPINEVDIEIRQQLIYIKKLEINVAYPFLLKVYDDYSNNDINKSEFIEVLEFIQSFTWRRFILGLPTNALNKIFSNLYKDVKLDDYVNSIQRDILSKPGSSRFPNNSEIKEAFRVKDMYNINSKNRTYCFERLENHDNKEFVKIDKNPDITIEHIFPQNPDPKWKKNLPNEEFKLINENYKNTIANLTLSGNNGKLSNKPFAEKYTTPQN